MPQNAVDDAWICNKGDDAHAAAAGAKQSFTTIIAAPQETCNYDDAECCSAIKRF
jgi:hypothetical protein